MNNLRRTSHTLRKLKTKISCEQQMSGTFQSEVHAKEKCDMRFYLLEKTDSDQSVVLEGTQYQYLSLRYEIYIMHEARHTISQAGNKNQEEEDS